MHVFGCVRLCSQRGINVCISHNDREGNSRGPPVSFVSFRFADRENGLAKVAIWMERIGEWDWMHRWIIQAQCYKHIVSAMYH